MAFTYTAQLQDRIARAVWNVGNNLLTAAQKTQLDNTWTSGTVTGGVVYDAWNEVAQLAQWFEQASSNPDTSFPQPAWDRLFVAKAAMILVKSVRPDRLQEFQKEHETALDEAVDTYTSTLITGSLAGQAITVAGIRAYVVNKCVKRANSSTGLRRRLFPNIADIDSEIQWVLNFLFNKHLWNFRKRQIKITIKRTSISTATWTEASKTLTQTGAFTDTAIGAGDRLIITGGTNVVTGDYLVTSRTSDDAIVLDTSLSSTAGNLSTGDITGIMYTVNIAGLRSGETFDAAATRRFYYDAADFGTTLEWGDDDKISASRAYYDTIQGQPRFFNFKQVGGGITTWYISPIPDKQYVLLGAAFVTSDSALASSTEVATEIGRFPPEFGTVIRDMVLARVLMQFSASDAERVWARAIDQVETMLPQYVDQGNANRDVQTLDVYGDVQAMLGSYGTSRGRLRGHSMGRGFEYGS